MSQPRVLVLAAGKGTRMKSERAKVLHPVCNKPMLGWVIDNALSLSPASIHVIVGHAADQVSDYITTAYPDGNVSTVLQEEQRGTGHATQVGLAALENTPDDAPIVILTGDAPLLPKETLAEMCAPVSAGKTPMALVASPNDGQLPYGHLVFDDNHTLTSIVEHKDASENEKALPLINVGFYAIAYGFLREAIAKLNDDNATGELYLTDVAAAAAAQGGAYVCEVALAAAMGVNSRADLARVEAFARSRIIEKHLDNGVTIVDPQNTYIGTDVILGSDVTLQPNVHLRGRTKIGNNTTIDTGTVITNCEIGANTRIKPHCVLTEAAIGDSCEVGPMARCRPQTVLENGVRVGNFVETKKTILKEGAKANHLSYLGDAVIGKRVNIGAGTITCNYDGFGKHQTTIEEGAFIGSDTQLVAPVTVGRDAYVGSGSTVTKDVPRAALALSRAKQVNIDGWADRFRAAQEKRGKKKS